MSVNQYYLNIYLHQYIYLIMWEYGDISLHTTLLIRGSHKYSQHRKVKKELAKQVTRRVSFLGYQTILSTI